jgi:hypothetical protein
VTGDGATFRPGLHLEVKLICRGNSFEADKQANLLRSSFRSISSYGLQSPTQRGPESDRSNRSKCRCRRSIRHIDAGYGAVARQAPRHFGSNRGNVRTRPSKCNRRLGRFYRGPAMHSGSRSRFFPVWARYR